MWVWCISFRLEQARKWLSNPGQDDKGLGRRAIALIVEEGRKVSYHCIVVIFLSLIEFLGS